ncbi:MAG: hypothetical protein RL660_3144 [Bacteroidota bacterium]
MMASLVYALSFIKVAKQKILIATLLFASLAVFCNFSMLNYFLALVFAIGLWCTGADQRKHAKRAITTLIIASVVLALAVYEPLRKLTEAGALYYGGDASFYADTLYSLARYTMYNSAPSAIVSGCLNVFLVLYCVSICLSFAYNRIVFSLRTFALFLLLVAATAVVIQFYLLGTPYLIDRTALFFYPLIVFSLFTALDTIAHTIIKALAIFIVMPLVANFLVHANLYKTTLWQFDARTKEVLAFLSQQAKIQRRKLHIDFSWPFQNSMDYYAKLQTNDVLKYVDDKGNRHAVSPQADYYVYLTKSLDKVGYNAQDHKILSVAKDTCLVFPEDGIIVFSIKKDTCFVVP